MGKYDHICELTGAENYAQWRRQMTLALQGERLWSHCSSETNPTNLADLASDMDIPTPANPKAITDAEKDKILDWLAKDAQAKALIDRKISPIVASLLNELQTARQQWDHLAQHYSRTDILSQYELRLRVRSEKLKDANDVTRFIGVFEDARRRFVQMGVTYTTEELIFDLLQGLPDGIEWEIFRELTLNKLSLSSSSTTTSTTSSATASSATFTFEDAAKLLTEKANAIMGRQKLTGPGSASTNAAVGGGKSGGGKIDTATGIPSHKNNPTGVRCTQGSCVDKPRGNNHDRLHCLWPGGGMGTIDSIDDTCR